MGFRSQRAAAKEKRNLPGNVTRSADCVVNCPGSKVEQNYVFAGPQGNETLADLFGGKSQLIIYHFMFGPGWEEGCPSCSMLADHLEGSLAHLATAMCALPWYRGRESARSKLSKREWDGTSSGFPHLRMASTATTTFPSPAGNGPARHVLQLPDAELSQR